jgi:hypothetical protein
MKDGPNARIQAVRVALAELGDAKPEMISAFAALRFGLDIAPSAVPLIRAIIQDRDRPDALRASRGPIEQQRATGNTGPGGE